MRSALQRHPPNRINSGNIRSRRSGPHHRRLLCEALEDRRMLSVGGSVAASEIDLPGTTDEGLFGNDFVGEVVPISPHVQVTESGGSTVLYENGFPSTDTYEVVLAFAPIADVTIEIASDSQVSVAPTSLLFTTTNWDQPQTVLVTVVDDNVANDSPLTSTITHTVSSAGDPGYDGLAVENVTATITDFDRVGITVSPTSGMVTEEPGGTAKFTVVLNTEPTASVTIDLSSDDTTEGTVSPSSLVFEPHDWNVAKTVTVTGVVDSVEDGDVAYRIVTAGAVSDDPKYDGLDADDVELLNQDDRGFAAVRPDPSRPGEQALFVWGTTGADGIEIRRQPSGELTVRVYELPVKRENVTLRYSGVFAPTANGHIYVYADGVSPSVGGDDRVSFDPFDIVRDVVVFGGPGNDHLQGGWGDDYIVGQSGNDQLYSSGGNDTLLGNSGRDRLYGRNGTDFLFGGVGRDILRGQSGNDVLVGGKGHDELYGGRGKDVLIGGVGRDKILGGRQRDILIAGSTDHDTNATALMALLAEWSQARGIDARIDHLKHGGGLNESYRLELGDTARDDGHLDRLFGQTGRDWFLYHTPDAAVDYVSGKDRT